MSEFESSMSNTGWNWKKAIQLNPIKKKLGVFNEWYDPANHPKLLIETWPDIWNSEYVQLIVKNSSNPKMFHDLDYASEIRKSILTESFKFFMEHSSFWKEKIPQVSGINAKELQDGNYNYEEIIEKLAVSSDSWRGNDLERSLIDDFDPKADYVLRFRSSGTSGKPPVTILRTPIDLYISAKIINSQFKFDLGIDFSHANFLIMLAPELAVHSAIGSLSQYCFTSTGSNIIYSSKYSPDKFPNARNMYQVLEPNKKAFMKWRFKKGKKFIYGGNISVQKAFIEPAFQLLGKKGLKNQILKWIRGITPINLGNGVVLTGGGVKTPGILDSTEIFRYLNDEKYLKTTFPIKYSDSWGASESLSVLPGFADGPKKFHPLIGRVFVDPDTGSCVSSGNNLEFIFFDPCVSYFGAVFPGDYVDVSNEGYITNFVRAKQSDRIGCFN